MLLIEAAKRLPRGKAVGVDIWQKKDQSGNAPDITRENARREGVSDRVELVTADLRELPFPAESFDAVISSLTVHNIPDESGRKQAIRELAHVLKPGGLIALLDIRHVSRYADELKRLGFADVRFSGLRFWIYPPVRVMTARKPDDTNGK
jgi:ubiquinone/menaquinone biosynthesis C-methylase UbiE